MNFHNISQRAVASYLKSLADFSFVAPQGCEPEQLAGLEQSERELHGFFHAAYENMAHCPELFGLPLDPDDCVDFDAPGRTQKMGEMNRKLRKVRGMIDRGLELLMAMGKDGKPEGQNLVLELTGQPTLLKQIKSAKKILAGLKNMGVSLSVVGDKAVLSSRQFPAMLPALALLAGACARYTDEKLGKFNFARCDFKALTPNYTPDAMDIYRVIDPADLGHIGELHRFFTGMNYRPICQIYGVFGWEVTYQGKRQIKSTPLFQIHYDERFLKQLSVQVKCASATRLAPIIGQQSPALQADFFRRANTCQGDKCHWCDSRPHLGPSEVEYNGEKRTICWYVNPDVKELNETTVDLIRQYAQMHEALN